ncbi:MAG: PIN domain-containing protein [Actinomycetota bacterium]
MIRSTAVRFIDTNVLLYAISSAEEEQDKALRANQILASADLGLSVQVLQEFCVQATRQTRSDRISQEHAQGLVESFMRFKVQPATAALVVAAIATCRRFGISFWDASILEAARELGCGTVLSEDLKAGEDYAGVLVENPFG